MNILKFFIKIYPIKIILKFFYCLFVEYIPNNIINNIPIARLRWLYYVLVLRHKIDYRAYIYLGIYIYPTFNSMKIGKYTNINRNCIFDGRGGLYVGDNVNISAEVAIYTGGHEMNSSNFAYYDKPVYIGDRVWIGTRAMIMPGVSVGEGAMIMPGAIVTKDVAPFSVVAGIPAKKIGERSKNLTYYLTWRSMFL